MSNFVQPYAALRRFVSEYVGLCRNILNFYSGLESKSLKKPDFPHPPAFTPQGRGAWSKITTSQSPRHFDASLRLGTMTPLG